MGDNKTFPMIYEIKQDHFYKKHQELFDLIEDFFSINEETFQKVSSNFWKYLKENNKYAELAIRMLFFFVKIRPKQRNVAISIYKIFQNIYSPHLKNILSKTIKPSFFEQLDLINHVHKPKRKEKLISSLEQFSNKEEQLNLLINEYKQNTLAFYLKNDDIGSLQQLVNEKSSFDFNQKLQFSPFILNILESENKDQKSTKSAALIDFCAFYGSIHCFKYLILNGSSINNESTPKYAVASGNFEIINILEHKSLSFNNCLPISITFHRNSIFDYLIVHYKIVNHYSCIKASLQSFNNMTFLVFANHISFDEFDEVTRNSLFKICVKNSNFPLIKYLFRTTHISLDSHIFSRDEAIKYACHQNNLPLTKFLFEKTNDQKSIKYAIKSGFSYACRENSLEIIKYIAEYSKNKNEDITKLNPDSLFQTGMKNFDVVKYLIEEVGFHINSIELITNSGDLPIHRASENGQLNIVKYLIEKHGADKNIKNNFGWTPLHYAALRGNISVADYLINSLGVDPEIQTKCGETPLILACCKNSNIEVIEYLIKAAKVNIEARDIDDMTPFLRACSYGHFDNAMFLTQNGCKIDVKDHNGKNALHFAARWNCSDIINYLIKLRTFDINVRDIHSQTPLHYACKYCDMQLPLLLLSIGADINAQDEDGKTPLHCLISRGINIDSLIQSCLHTPKNINVNIKDKYGKTPLYCACERKDLTNVKILLVKTGADPEIPNNKGITPIILVASNPYSEVTLKPLIDKANYNKSHQIGSKTCSLHIASERFSTKSLSILRSLLENGYDKDSQNETGDTILHIACKNENPYLVRYLIKTVRVNKEIKNYKGETAFDICCQKKNPDIINLFLHYASKQNESISYINSLLISGTKYNVFDATKFAIESLGADPNAQSDDGLCPIHYAALNGNFRFLEYLVKQPNININIKTPDGRTAKDIFVATPQYRMAKLKGQTYEIFP